MDNNLFNMGEPKLYVSNQGLHIADRSIAEAIEKKEISPSLITSLEGCAAQWVGSTYVIKNLFTEEDNAATRGSLFHRVMELFFTLPAEERTKTNLNNIVKNTLNETDFQHFRYNEDAKKWLKDALINYYNMGANPKKVEVATIKDMYGRDKLGLEVFVKGKIGETSKNTLGFIDTLIIDPRRPDHVFISDWKSGGTVHKWNPKTKNKEGIGEARQQVIYGMLLEKNYGLKVSGARLVYPAAINKETGEYTPEVVKIDLNDEKFNQNVVKSVEKTEEKMSFMLENNVFDYSPNAFCAWCPLAKICPQANILPYKKMQIAFDAQPTPDQLGDYFQSI